MKYFAIALAAVLSPLTLAAQNNVKSEQPVMVFRGNVVGDSCAIGMRASQGVWDHTVRVSQQQEVTSHIRTTDSSFRPSTCILCQSFLQP